MNSQQSNTVKARISKSTITTVASSCVSISNNNYFIAQSIGQKSIIGKVEMKSMSVEQGFLNNVISFKIKNSADKPINEVLNFVVSPNPFIDNIKIDFSEKTTKDIYIKIYDINGKTYENIKYPPTNKIEIPLNLPSVGTYLIQVSSGSSTLIKKIIKTNG